MTHQDAGPLEDFHGDTHATTQFDPVAEALGRIKTKYAHTSECHMITDLGATAGEWRDLLEWIEKDGTSFAIGALRMMVESLKDENVELKKRVEALEKAVSGMQERKVWEPEFRAERFPDGLK